MSIVINLYYYYKKRTWIKKFCFFDMSSAIGEDGIGKGCKLSGFGRVTVGKDCYFGKGTEITALENHFEQKLDANLIIKNHVRCVGGCRITCAGNITLEDDVLIGPDVFITDHNHGMNPTKKGGYSAQSLIVKDVVIKTGVWLGQRVCVLPGVTIGAHSIIGANSVVTHDVPSYAIAVGAPARVVKKWDKERKEWVPIEGKERQ